jgi:hypothetical protein
MQNVPKIVVDHLRAGPSEIQHPDADMLTAFAERSLLVRERATVVDHLAQCHDCRDIVMLALPAVDSAQGDAQIVVRPSRAGWLTWPALRWGLAAAGIVVVASLGILRYEQTARPVAMLEQKDGALLTETQQQPSLRGTTSLPAAAPQKITETHTDKDAASAVSASAPAGSVAETIAPRAGDSRKSEPGTADLKSQPQLMARAVPSPAFHMPAFGARIGGPHANAISNGQNISGQQQNQNISVQQQAAAQAQQNAAAMNIPHASETVEVSNASPLVQTETVQVDNPQTVDGVEAQNQAAPLPSVSSPSSFDNNPGLVRAKPAIKAEFGPQWVVTATGGLQRSFDQGSTWQDVNVTANLYVPAKGLPANGRDFSALTTLAPAKTNQQESSEQSSSEQSSSGQSSSAHTAAKQDLYKKAAAVPTAPSFRTVAANGGEVWAGGSNAALYHSADAGNHWTQVVPSAAGAALTGDVVRVEFTDALHGKVTTSTSETWITSDGGQIWQKQ